MQVRILTSIAGNADPENGLEQGFAFHAGQQVDLPDDLAAKWIASKTAAPVGSAPEPKSAAKKSRG